jgi:diacylglycerol O-acyltransferase / wax synthase
MLLPMSPTDSMFLVGESREHPMHVGGLVLFEPREGTRTRELREMFGAAANPRSISTTTSAITPCPGRAGSTS